MVKIEVVVYSVESAMVAEHRDADQIEEMK